MRLLSSQWAIIIVRTCHKARRMDATDASFQQTWSAMLKVLVVSMGNGISDEKSRLRHELSLVRSAILYADEVQLMSPRAELLTAESSLLRLGDQLNDLVSSQIDPRAQARIRGDANLSRELGEIEAAVTSHSGIWQREIDELITGQSTGILQVVPFLSKPEAGQSHESTAFLSRLSALINDPSTHPLLDERSAALGREASVAHPFTDDARRRARTTELGAGMVARLPTFPQAPLDELLDVKAEFGRALLRYRALVSDLQSLLSSDIGAREIDAELDDLWIRKVAPTMLAIEEEFEQHSFVRELAKSFTTSARSLITQGAGLYIALSTLGNLASHISAAAAASGIVAEAVAGATARSMEFSRSNTREEFYYLYELSRVKANLTRNLQRVGTNFGRIRCGARTAGLRLSPAKTQVLHMSEPFGFLGFRIQWKRKRGTDKRYVYTFTDKRPIRTLKDKVRALTHKTSQRGAAQGRADPAQPDHARMGQLLPACGQQAHHESLRPLHLAQGDPQADATTPLEVERRPPPTSPALAAAGGADRRRAGSS